jgi:hypothetical protein
MDWLTLKHLIAYKVSAAVETMDFTGTMSAAVTMDSDPAVEWADRRPEGSSFTCAGFLTGSPKMTLQRFLFVILPFSFFLEPLLGNLINSFC